MLELIYGALNEKVEPNKIFLCEENLQIPFGTAGYDSPLSILKKIEKSKFNNSYVYEKFQYKDFSLWWFMYPTIFPALKKIINFIDEFEKIINIQKPKSVKIVDEFDKLTLIKKICSKYNIPIKYSKSQNIKFKTRSKFLLKMQKNRFQNITETKNQSRMNLFKKNFSNLPKINESILFAIPTAYRRKIFDHTTNQSTQGEYIQGSIIKMLEKMNFKIIGMDLDYTFRGDIEILEQRLNDSIPWFPMEKILSKNNSSDLDNFIQTYLKLIKTNEFQDLFNYEEINFWDEIQPEFEKLSYMPHLPTYIKMVDDFTEFLKNNAPKAVFLPYENGPLALALILACQKNGIKTIGIQHGIIYPRAPSYVHDIFKTKDTPLGMPLPDFTLLFGNYAKALLTKTGSYPEEKFLVFGNPEFFSREQILSNLDPKKIHDKYSIPEDKKIILFATSKMQRYYNFYGKLNYDEQVWEQLLENFGSNNKYYLILKPHPDENIDVYKKILSKYNIENVKIINDNLFELISMSSIVISIISTVIIDALCLKKPVMKIDFGFTNPIYDNVEPLSSSTLENIHSSIIDIIENHTVNTKLESDIENFVHEHYNVKELYPENILKEILT